MLRTMLQAKLHGVQVTRCDLHYEGSCGIDEALLDLSGMLQNQYIEIYNVTNGERFTTYVIPEPRYSGQITLNGAAARKVAIGDTLIICAYASYDEPELRSYRPNVVLVGDGNKPKLKT